MKILFLTDSLALPRTEVGKKISIHDTYFECLKKQCPQHQFTLVAIGGATILDLYKQVFYYKVLEADLVFLQCGIVDCAPRAFTSRETKFLTKTGLFNIFKPMVKGLRKYRGHKYTKPKKFQHYLSSIQNDLKPARLYSIGILPASEEYEKKIPGIAKSIHNYNSILEKNSILINTADFPMNGILSDHHHLNAIGHEIIFEKIKKIIDAI